jgi:hypothetical protein
MFLLLIVIACSARMPPGSHLIVYNKPSRRGSGGHFTNPLMVRPQDLLAQAAADCGAHARALLYFEAHVRAAHGGGYNPAAHKSTVYSDDDVSYLQARWHHRFYSSVLQSDIERHMMHLVAGVPFAKLCSACNHSCEVVSLNEICRVTQAAAL